MLVLWIAVPAQLAPVQEVMSRLADWYASVPVENLVLGVSARVLGMEVRRRRRKRREKGRGRRGVILIGYG